MKIQESEVNSNSFKYWSVFFKVFVVDFFLFFFFLSRYFSPQGNNSSLFQYKTYIHIARTFKHHKKSIEQKMFTFLPPFALRENYYHNFSDHFSGYFLYIINIYCFNINFKTDTVCFSSIFEMFICDLSNYEIIKLISNI